MKLTLKIFITFFVSVIVLLCTTLYLIDTQAEQREVRRIIADLDKAQAQFQHDLETRQKHIQSLSQIITSDQKFRSFLSQIKDNFYPFTAEIGKDLEADFVFMLDDNPTIRAVYATSDTKKQPLSKNFSAFNITNRLNLAVIDSEMISLEDNLYSSHFIPLKENLKDEYAVGLIVISNQINDRWLTQLLPSTTLFQAVFFNNLKIVAKNTDEAMADAILKHRNSIIEKGLFLWQNQRYIAKQILFNSDKPDTGYILSANLDQALAEFKHLQQQVLFIGGVILLIGAILFILISKRITKPLQLITRGTQAINKGDYRHRISYQSKDEVGQLANAFNVMAKGLQEKEKIRNTFNQYIDPTIVNELLSQPDDLKLGGERKEQTVLFSDITGFTNFSEKLPAEALVNLLNEYLTAMTQEISLQQGILDKFIGDAVMAFWNPLICKDQHAQFACYAAINMQKKLDILRPLWIDKGQPEIRVRIGIATGEMIVGNIGSDQARSYTCIGDKVNYSSRLENLNKYYGTKIIIDQKTASSISCLIVRELDNVRVKGREQGEKIYELVGKEEEIKGSEIDQINRYQQGLLHYRNAEFSAAKNLFSSIEKDIPSQIMFERCIHFEKNPPENWNSVHTMEIK